MFLPINYGKIIDAFKESKKIGLITTYKNNGEIFSNNILVGADQLIQAYDRKNEDRMNQVDAGLLVLKKRLHNSFQLIRIVP